MYNHNAQGNYNAGRGPDGLGLIRTGSRFGFGVRNAERPTRIGGRRNFVVDRRATIMPVRTPAQIYLPLSASTIATAAVRRRKPSRLQKIRDRRQFINWIKRWSPGLYAAAKAKADLVERNEATLGGLSGWWETFTEGLTDVAGKVIQFKTQKEILDAQMERMRQGLPPLQTSEYAPTIAIKPDPGTTREITGAIGAGFGSLLPWIVAGGVGLFLLTKK